MFIKKPVLVALVALILVFAGATVYSRWQYADLKANPQKTVQEEVQTLVNKVSRLIVLPEGETPTVATVADPSKLKDQAFFANAKVGDKVLIYANLKKAILYDPNQDIIIEVAPVNIGQ